MIHKYLQSVIGGVGLALIVACSIGCDASHLNAIASSHLAYNEERDEFHHLRVYQHIRATRESSGNKESPEFVSGEKRRGEALDYLASLWKNREDVIVWPNLITPLAGAEAQLLYLSSREFRMVNLGSRSNDSKVYQSLIDLDRVRIRPGEFFLSSEKSLCYSHACVVPGAVVDDFISHLVGEGCDRSLDQLTAKRQARSMEKEARIAWSELQEKCLKDVTTHWRFEAIGKWMDGSASSLSDESIRLLIRQTSGHELKIRRKGLVFSAEVQVTPEDAKAFLAGYDRILNGDLPPAKLAAMPIEIDRVVFEKRSRILEVWTPAVRKACKLVGQENGRLTVSIDLGPIFAAFEVTQNPFDLTGLQLTPEAIKDSKEDVAALQERSIPLNKQLTLEAIQLDFRAASKK